MTENAAYEIDLNWLSQVNTHIMNCSFISQSDDPQHPPLKLIDLAPEPVAIMFLAPSLSLPFAKGVTPLHPPLS